MKRSLLIQMVFLGLAIALAPAVTRADDPAARKIMEQVEAVDDGDMKTADMLMVLIDKAGNKREKFFKTYGRDEGEDTKQIMFIERPANIRNTGFLTWDYDAPEKDTDQWLYLPALGKPKRIASSDQDGSFMGSDLNYSDMNSRNLDDFHFKLLKEMTLKGEKVWLIESLPRSEKVIDKTGYKKSILAVRQDNYLVSRVKSWTKSGGYVKIIDFGKLETIDGILVYKETRVVKKQGKKVKHKTRILLSNVKFNQNLPDDMFTLRRLKKGL